MLKRDNSYFDGLYSRYIDEIYRFVCCKVNYNKSITEDLTQEIFIDVYKSLPYFKGLSSERTWIYKIARNNMNDYYRKCYRNTISMVELNEDVCNGEELMQTDIEQYILYQIQKEEVRNCLAMMTDHYRNVLLMKYMDGYSVKEIAVIFDKTVKSVDNLLRRAKMQFTEIYNEMRLKDEEGQG